jgi:hypothetical protein
VKARKLGGWEAGRPGGEEARKLGSGKRKEKLDRTNRINRFGYSLLAPRANALSPAMQKR